MHKAETHGTDPFGITMLYPSAGSRLPWYCKWDSHPREIPSVSRDPRDAEFEVRGDEGQVTIDGQGVATLSGKTPRMYVYVRGATWCNVEVTFYGQRLRECKGKSSQGFVVGARSEHQDADHDPCAGTAYYARMLYDGRANFQKELSHPGDDGVRQAYTSPQPGDNDASRARRWPDTTDHTMPKRQWIGYKYVLRTIAASTVRLELYRDRTEGADGGSWECLAQCEDTGNWPVTNLNSLCAGPPTRMLLTPATSVFVRNDYLIDAKYRQFSVREIDPSPLITCCVL